LAVGESRGRRERCIDSDDARRKTVTLAEPRSTADDSAPLLSVVGLRAHLFTRYGVVKAVDDVSFTVSRGETLGLVGESGSGKTMTCLALLRLLPAGGRIVGGSVRYAGDDLLGKSEREMRRIRGKHIAMILQDPMTSLNPVLSVGDQVSEPIRRHQRLGLAAARRRAIEALTSVRIPAAAERIADYPHQLSGGMRQRVMGAIALSCAPGLLIADEPTTSLDVTIQAQYLALLQEVQHTHGVAIIFVTHDLGIVAKICRRVAVMYAGKIVELVPVEDLFDDPLHPYSRALLGAIPRADRKEPRLPTIEGQPPQLSALGAGCAFAPRCPSADAACRAEAPPPVVLGDGRMVRCWKVADDRRPH
jgi:oligopeptide/dipeptide ABC transporter ATP-binding protein